MHLRFDCQGAGMSGENRHPQQVMKALGITYQHATPQSMIDEWWFWNCEGVPAELPGYLLPLNVAPHAVIGRGLSRENADKIAAKEKP